MKSRRKAREAALQALYQCDTLGEWGSDAIAKFFAAFYPAEWAGNSSRATDTLAHPDDKVRASEQENHEFTVRLIEGTISHLPQVDQLIMAASTHWSLARMSRVDRNILRIATFELQFEISIPVNVVINEAIEIAKSYGSDESPMFINGVLDFIARSVAKDRMVDKKDVVGE